MQSVLLLYRSAVLATAEAEERSAAHVPSNNAHIQNEAGPTNGIGSIPSSLEHGRMGTHHDLGRRGDGQSATRQAILSSLSLMLSVQYHYVKCAPHYRAVPGTTDSNSA